MTFSAETPAAEGDATSAVVAHTLLNSATVAIGLVDTLIGNWERFTDHERRQLLERVRRRLEADRDVLLGLVRVLPAEVR